MHIIGIVICIMYEKSRIVNPVKGRVGGRSAGLAHRNEVPGKLSELPEKRDRHDYKDYRYETQINSVELWSRGAVESFSRGVVKSATKQLNE